MTAKEIILKELEHEEKLKPFERMLYSKMLQDIKRLEQYDKILNLKCGNCVNKENKICVGMDAPISIDTLINCLEMDRDESINECNRLLKENGKLKKVLDVLKCNLSVEYIEEYEPNPYKLLIDYEFRTITQQEYDFLKEVLE